MERRERIRSSGIGFWTLVSLVVANMIGVGVFTSSGFSMAALGNPGRVMLGWALCGVWAICGAIAYGGLVSRLPQSGGEYLFLSKFVHPSIGFLAGWISLVAGFTAPIAASAKSAAIHILPGTSSGDFSTGLVAAGIVALALCCHLAGLRVAASIQNSIVAIKLSLLLWILAVAFLMTGSGQWLGGALPERDPAWLPKDAASWWILAGSMSWLALSYTGFNAAIYVAGESQKGAKHVARAMLVGTMIVTAFYLALNVVFVYLPPSSLLLGDQGFGEERVAAVAAKVLGGERLESIMRSIIILSTCSSVWAMLLMGPRVYQRMASDGVFPRIFEDTTFRKTLILQALLSLVICFWGNLLDLLSYLGLTLSLSGAVAVSSLWWIEQRLPQAKPLSWIEKVAASLYLALTAILIAASAQQRPGQFWAMVATFVAGIVVFAVWRGATTKKEADISRQA